MKERSQCSDGSRYYGNGVWGPSTADLQRANLSFFHEKPKIKEEPNNDLLFISSESVFGKFFQTASKIKLPAKFAIPVGLAVAVVAVACGSKNSEESKLPSTPRPSESGAFPNPENPFAVLTMPFPKDSLMAIQQGWFYTDNTEHKGIDFIKGMVDDSKTWKSFPVIAAVDGYACANPPSRQGNAVLVRHESSKAILGYTYYGHLNNIENDIPTCDPKDTTKVKFEKQGTKLGDAGATGVTDPKLTHLHFQVNDANENPVDPYDLRGKRDVYPDPNFKNGKPCGPQALFIDCYPKGAVVASPKDPIPPISGKVNEKSVSIAEKPVEKARTVIVPGTQPWTDTDIDVNRGDRVSISGSGIVKIAGSDPGKTPAGGDGTDCKVSPNFPTAAAPCWSLVGRIENGHIFPVGPETEFFVTSPGRLYLGINDDFVGDNSGSWTTAVSVNGSAPKPTETPKPSLEKKISISKKPDELFKALLTNSISSDTLPQGMSSGGISASEIDATGKALKQIGAVNILIEDSVSKANGGVAYAIFPDSATAKSASELVGTHLGNGQVLEDFPYPTKIYTIQGIFETSTTVILMSVQNVTVVTSLTGSKFIGTNVDLIQPRTISLGHAAIEHLGKVGK